jgi:hypothetical protein
MLKDEFRCLYLYNSCVNAMRVVVKCSHEEADDDSPMSVVTRKEGNKKQQVDNR